MSALRYISVILPLKLGWEPVYATDDPSLETGDRVAVRFAGVRYVGVVSGPADAGIDPARIRPILGRETGLERIGAGEIAFWHAVADYYLCTVGEVYKAAYPALKTEKEEVLARQRIRLQERLQKRRQQLEKARKDETRARYEAEIRTLEAELSLDGERPAVPLPQPVLSAAQEKAWKAVQEAFSAGKVTLLQGRFRSAIYRKAAADTLVRGRSVLLLVPDIARNRSLEAELSEEFGAALTTYHSAHPAARKRAVAEALRRGEPTLVLGTRSALFLPWRKLGLIIVDQEQDPLYKQDSPAPRYQARDSAIMLASTASCPVLLGSATPSFESLYNARSGRYRAVTLQENAPIAPVLLIDTVAERRKRGMDGELSRKLQEQIREQLAAGGQAALVLPRRCRDTDSAAIESALQAAFPDISTARIDPDSGEEKGKAVFGAFARGTGRLLVCPQGALRFWDDDGPGLIAVLQAERLVGGQDFRADERALQVLEMLRQRAGAGLLVLQSAQAEHPVFRILQGLETVEGRLLEERRKFAYPPFTRLVDIQLRDGNAKRLDFLARELAATLPQGLSVTGPYAPGPEHAEGLQLRIIRIALQRDAGLSVRKKALADTLARFGKERNYASHLCLDVDPA